MSDNAYESWSLHELKTAAAAADASGLDGEVTGFDTGRATLATVGQRLDAALAGLSDAWTGTAAQAAATSARRTIASIDLTSQTASRTSDRVTTFAQDVRSTQQEVAAIPDSPFDWGEALTAGGVAGLIGLGGDALVQHVEAERNRRKAVDLVTRMDVAGREHAVTMKVQPWREAPALLDAPTVLPPPAAPAHSQRMPTPIAGTRASNGTGDAEFRDTYSARPDHSTDRKGDDDAARHVRSDDVSPSAGRTSATGGVDLAIPSASNGGAAPGPTSAPAVPAVPAGVTAAVIGGAGVVAGSLGAVRGNTTLAASGSDTGVSDHAPGRTAGGTSTGGRDDGKADAAGRGRGRVGLEPGTTTSGRAASELVMRERPASPVNGYPLAGATGRPREDEDELRERPEYLVESDDIWGDGRTAAPPVLG